MKRKKKKKEGRKKRKEKSIDSLQLVNSIYQLNFMNYFSVDDVNVEDGVANRIMR
jgi:hypothetical protein